MSVRVRANGFAPGGQTIDLRSWHPSWDVEVYVELQAEGRVRGVVTDTAGNPVHGARIFNGRIGSSNRIGRFIAPSTHSRTDGSYELLGVGHGTTSLAVEHAELGRAETELRLPPGAVAEWNPVLSPLPRFRGILLGEDGAPLERWRVVAIV